MTVQKNWDDPKAAISIMVTRYMMGATPAEAQIDAHISYLAGQAAYAQSIGVNPVVYMGESLGNGQVDSAPGWGPFYSQHLAYPQNTSGAVTGDNNSWVAVVYPVVFGRQPTVAQVQAFVAQINYFYNLYVPVFGGGAHVHARGAVAGQMFGHLWNESGNTVSRYRRLATAFITDAENTDGSQVPFSADGFSTYGI